MTIYPRITSQVLAEAFKTAMAEGADEATRNQAAEHLQSQIRKREVWEEISEGYYGLNEEHELRRLLEEAVDNGKVTSPAVVSPIRERRSSIESMVAADLNRFKATFSQEALPPKPANGKDQSLEI
jgi:hypothetical protein